MFLQCFYVFILLIFIQWSQSQESGFLDNSFTCRGRSPGYYADVATGCKTYHVCDGNSQFSYACPPRTLFQPKTRICDHWYRVDCHDTSSEDLTHFGDNNDKVPESVGNSLDIADSLEDLSDFNGNEDDDDDDDDDGDWSKRPPTTWPTTTETTDWTTPVATESSNRGETEASVPEISSNETHINLKLRDFRFLFFIAEKDNKEPIGKKSTDLILPLYKSTFLRFYGRKVTKGSCPGYCNPKYLVSGTCHPCIMIK